MDFPCIDCNHECRPKQESLECPQCQKWQHRTCTEVSRADYRAFNKGVHIPAVVAWRCLNCLANEFHQPMDISPPASPQLNQTYVIRQASPAAVSPSPASPASQRLSLSPIAAMLSPLHSPTASLLPELESTALR